MGLERWQTLPPPRFVCISYNKEWSENGIKCALLLVIKNENMYDVLLDLYHPHKSSRTYHRSRQISNDHPLLGRESFDWISLSIHSKLCQRDSNKIRKHIEIHSNLFKLFFNEIYDNLKWTWYFWCNWMGNYRGLCAKFQRINLYSKLVRSE